MQEANIPQADKRQSSAQTLCMSKDDMTGTLFDSRAKESVSRRYGSMWLGTSESHRRSPRDAMSQLPLDLLASHSPALRFRVRLLAAPLFFDQAFTTASTPPAPLANF
jgi:hypothetical protein